MAISVFQVQSPLTQVTRERTNEYLKTVGSAVGEELVRVDLDEFEKAPFALVFVASGGSEGIFKEGYERICKKPCYILTSGESNSLAASMEILSFLKQQGKRGEILHGSVEDVARRINALKMAYAGIEKLKGMRLGVIGVPSDWLIASDTDGAAYQAKLGLTLVHTHCGYGKDNHIRLAARPFAQSALRRVHRTYMRCGDLLYNQPHHARLQA